MQSQHYSEDPILKTISNKNGMSVTVMDWGATLISIKVPVRGGGSREVLLGVKDPAKWSTQSCYFNATIGRFANRIANSSFEIGKKKYALESADRHTLHGGKVGFDKKRFKIVREAPNALVLELFSPDGDMGFPGNYTLQVTYEVCDDNELRVHYQASCDQKCWTCITNHSYFNLNGRHSSSLGHTVQMDSEAFLPIDEGSIPTGEVRPVKGTAFDFTSPKTVGRDFMKDDQMKLAGGYDHPFLIKGSLLKPFVKATSEDGRLSMEVSTDYPAFQFYSANYVGMPEPNIVARDDGRPYENQTALCFEPEFYPDCPHMPQFAAKNPMIEPCRPLSRSIFYKFI
jgi:aldose 1-epimerase